MSETARASNPSPPAARRHWWWLLLATVLVQALMFVSYPLGTGIHNDNEAAQRYLMSEYAAGNFQVGNVRYNTGYALVVSPFKVLTDRLGRLAERSLLLIHLLAYSTIPFMVYDMLRRRFDPTTALVSALLVLIDPFGLQWAHFQLPGWLIALGIVWVLWLAQLAWDASVRRRLLLVGLAACGLGVLSFARFNFAPLAAVYGLSFLLWRHIPRLQRLALTALVAACSGAVLAAYILLIHIPSTGTSTLSCTAGATLVASLPEKGFPIRASNGPQSAHYARLLTLEAAGSTDFYGATYPLWQNPGPWVTEAERAAFFAQPFGEPQENIAIVFPAALYWHLGPCAADGLLYEVYLEAVASDLPRLLLEILKAVALMLVQHPTESTFPPMYLDHSSAVNWLDAGWLGFYRAESAMYNGHRVWAVGMRLYETLFAPLNLIKWLSPLAVLAAFWRRDWLLVTMAAMLLLGLTLIAAAASMEPRYYAMLAPLFMILIGCLAGAGLERVKNRN